MFSLRDKGQNDKCSCQVQTTRGWEFKQRQRHMDLSVVISGAGEIDQPGNFMSQHTS